MYLSIIEEQREDMAYRITLHQARVMEFFDRKARPRNFMEGDMVLLWDKRRDIRGAHGSFDLLWRGPFKIQHTCGRNSFKLTYIDGIVLPMT